MAVPRLNPLFLLFFWLFRACAQAELLIGGVFGKVLSRELWLYVSRSAYIM